MDPSFADFVRHLRGVLLIDPPIIIMAGASLESLCVVSLASSEMPTKQLLWPWLLASGTGDPTEAAAFTMNSNTAQWRSATLDCR